MDGEICGLTGGRDQLPGELLELTGPEGGTTGELTFALKAIQ